MTLPAKPASARGCNSTAAMLADRPFLGWLYGRSLGDGRGVKRRGSNRRGFGGGLSIMGKLSQGGPVSGQIDGCEFVQVGLIPESAGGFCVRAGPAAWTGQLHGDGWGGDAANGMERGKLQPNCTQRLNVFRRADALDAYVIRAAYCIP